MTLTKSWFCLLSGIIYLIFFCLEVRGRSTVFRKWNVEADYLGIDLVQRED